MMKFRNGPAVLVRRRELRKAVLPSIFVSDDDRKLLAGHEHDLVFEAGPRPHLGFLPLEGFGEDRVSSTGIEAVQRGPAFDHIFFVQIPEPLHVV